MNSARSSNGPAGPGAENGNRRGLFEQKVLVDNALEFREALDKQRKLILSGGAGPNAARAFQHHGELGGQLLSTTHEGPSERWLIVRP